MWLLAWRNLWRNKTRTGITMTAIAASLALQLCSMGVADSMYGKLTEGAVRTAGGDFLVHAEGYWRSRGSDLLIEEGDALIAQAERTPHVEIAIPRILMSGIIRSARESAGAEIVAIDHEREARLVDPAKNLVEGEFLGDNVKDPIVLGKKLVDDLGLKIGKRVVVMVTRPDGEPGRGLFRLGGVLDTGSPLLDKGAAYVRLDGARKALGLEGSEITQLGVLVDEREQRHLAAHLFEASLDLKARTATETLTWDRAMPQMVDFIEIDANSNAIFAFIIFLVVAFGIANTFLMAVLERIRELGLLSAIGLKPRRIAGLVLRETVVLAIVSIAIGLALGFGAHSLIAANGIDYAELSGAGNMEMAGVVMDDMVIRSVLEPARWINACVVVFGLVILSALYPAWRATRLDPAQAMRTYE